ncbi:hypothetical protein JL721_5517 [Aureococcus anophagefferens]|nr:hypothetical protein JL721_5517 [Aureococcus anophagefferens]
MSKLAETEEELRGGKPSAAALAAAGAKAWAEMQPDGAASLERLASLAAGGDADPVESIKWYRAAKDATPGGGKIWDKHKLRVVA